jgi:hypothetical protein
VKAKSEDDIKDFLIAKREELNLKNEYIDKIYKQEINGVDFLDSTTEDFERWGVPGGPAKRIVRLIKEIQGGKRTSRAVIFANNTEYLLILVLFFPASYRQTRPKNTFAFIVDQGK